MAELTEAQKARARERMRIAYSLDPEKFRKRSQAWAAAHPEKKRELDRKYRLANREKIDERVRNWIAANPERRNAISRQWAAANPGKVNALTVFRRVGKRCPSWVDREEIKRIYVDCPKGWHVDHIVPLRGFTPEGYPITGLHVPWNLRAIPAVENWRKNKRMRVEDVV